MTAAPPGDFPTHPLGVPGVSHPQPRIPTARLRPGLRAPGKKFPVLGRTFSPRGETSGRDGSRRRALPALPRSLPALQVRPSSASRPAASVPLRRRVRERCGRGAPSAGLVTRFPPLSAYGRLLPAAPPPTFPVLFARLHALSSDPRPTSPHPTPLAATLTLLGKGGEEAPALRCNSTISGNPSSLT